MRAAPSGPAAPLLARLVDRGSGGHFVLRPSVDYEVERHYVGETMVLETNYQTASGTLRVTEALNQGTPGSPPWRELAR